MHCRNELNDGGLVVELVWLSIFEGVGLKVESSSIDVDTPYEESLNPSRQLLMKKVVEAELVDGDLLLPRVILELTCEKSLDEEKSP